MVKTPSEAPSIDLFLSKFPKNFYDRHVRETRSLDFIMRMWLFWNCTIENKGKEIVLEKLHRCYWQEIQRGSG